MGRPRTATVPTARRLRLHRVPVLIWLVIVVQSLLILCTGVLYPSFQEPDEVAHVDYVLAHRHGEWLDGPGQRRIQLGVIRARGQVPDTQQHQSVGDRPPVPRGQRKSFDQLGTQPYTKNLPNQMVQHPPLYYGMAAMLSYLVPNFSHRGYDVQLFWLRLISMLLFAPIPLLLWRMGRTLTGSDPVGLIAAIFPLGMPAYLRIGASVSNDALMMLLGMALLYLLAKVVRGDLSRRTALWVGGIWGLGLLTKGFALAMLPIIPLAYLVGARGRLLPRVRAAIVPIVIAEACGLLLGGWWWVRNVIVYGHLQPSGYGPQFPVNRLFGPDRPGGTEGNFLQTYFSQLGTRLFGSLGLIDEPRMPFAFVVTLAVIFLLLIALGISIGLRRASSPRWAGVTLLLPALATLAVMYVGSRSTYFHVRVITGVQVRYFLPFLAGGFVLLGVGLCRLLRPVSRWLPTATYVLAIAFQTVAALFVLNLQFGDASPGLAHRIRVGISFVTGWTAFPQGVTVLIVLGTIVAVLGLLVALIRQARGADLPAVFAHEADVAEAHAVDDEAHTASVASTLHFGQGPATGLTG